MAMMQRSGPEAAGLNLPAYSPEQQLPLSGNQITIGRRRHSTGESPDIDLSVPPEDPGVSHQHAVLVQQPDGCWAVVDQNSTNGTTINGGEDPIQPYVPVPLHGRRPGARGRLDDDHRPPRLTTTVDGGRHVVRRRRSRPGIAGPRRAARRTAPPGRPARPTGGSPLTVTP